MKAGWFNSDEKNNWSWGVFWKLFGKKRKTQHRARRRLF
jgi:hypothetical protein